MWEKKTFRAGDIKEVCSSSQALPHNPHHSSWGKVGPAWKSEEFLHCCRLREASSNHIFLQKRHKAPLRSFFPNPLWNKALTSEKRTVKPFTCRGQERAFSRWRKEIEKKLSKGREGLYPEPWYLDILQPLGNGQDQWKSPTSKTQGSTCLKPNLNQNNIKQPTSPKDQACKYPITNNSRLL